MFFLCYSFLFFLSHPILLHSMTRCLQVSPDDYGGKIESPKPSEGLSYAARLVLPRAARLDLRSSNCFGCQPPESRESRDFDVFRTSTTAALAAVRCQIDICYKLKEFHPWIDCIDVFHNKWGSILPCKCTYFPEEFGASQLWKIAPSVRIPVTRHASGIWFSRCRRDEMQRLFSLPHLDLANFQWKPVWRTSFDEAMLNLCSQKSVLSKNGPFEMPAVLVTRAENRCPLEFYRIFWAG